MLQPSEFAQEPDCFLPPDFKAGNALVWPVAEERLCIENYFLIS